METKKRRWPVIILIIFILAVAALYICLYLLPQISESLKPTATVQYDKVELTDDVHCIVVRDEQLVYAQRSGNVSYYSNETEKTRKGYTVADIYSGGNKYTVSCPSTGFVSYYLDGMENYFVPSKLGEINIDEIKDLILEPTNNTKNTVETGDPIFKLITSNTWYFMLLVPDSDLAQYSLNSKVIIKMPDGEQISATVNRFLGDGDTKAVVCSTKIFYSNFAKLRTMDLTVITKSFEGLSFPKTALATEGEKQGVYVLGIDDEYSFKEVEVISEYGENILAAEGQNLKLYDEILRDAKSYSSSK